MVAPGVKVCCDRQIELVDKGQSRVEIAHYEDTKCSN